MPTYEYQCPDGHVFEKFQKMSDKPRADCPVCGKAASRKISGGAGLVFKGTGFYITDYGKDGKGPRKEGTERTEKADKAEKIEKPVGGGGESKSRPGDGPKTPETPAKSANKGKASSE
jgi:putative FmdB family regulatory protein